MKRNKGHQEKLLQVADDAETHNGALICRSSVNHQFDQKREAGGLLTASSFIPGDH